MATEVEGTFKIGDVSLYTKTFTVRLITTSLKTPLSVMSYGVAFDS
jgi:hypothetical protein